MSTNILAVGDLHLRKNSPAMRTDDFFNVLSDKLDEIFEIATLHACRYIVFPGDIFDRSDAPYGLVEWAIHKFSSPSYECLFVYGQHDLRYHTSDKQNTPLGVLVAGLGEQAVILQPAVPFVIKKTDLQINIYGCSWGESLPDKLPASCFNIMVMHRPISVDPLPWNHPDFLLAKDLVKKCPAKLFITGDNHVQFIAKYKHGSVVNMGSVMRTTTAQIDHKPAVSIIKIENDSKFTIERVPLTVRKGVFDMEQGEAKIVKEERIAKFISELQGEFDPELNFLDNLRSAVKDCPAGVQKILKEVLN